MGKCFSCLKSTSSQNQVNEPIKRDITQSSKEENNLMFKHSQCTVPHLQTVTVLFKKNGCMRTLSQVTNEDGIAKDKSHRSFHGKISAISQKSVNVVVENKNSKLISDNKINSLYDIYKDPGDVNFILPDGIERLCADLNLLPDEFKVLVLAWKFDAYQMCQFTKEEFTEGCKKLKVDSLKGIKQRLTELVLNLDQDRDAFKSLYKYTFTFGLDNNAGQRILPIDIAVCLWKLVFTIHEPPVLSRWINFLHCNPHIRGIPRDTWNMFLNFSESVGDNLSDYDDTEAWPSIFDEFVEFENDKINENYNLTSKEKFE